MKQFKDYRTTVYKIIGASMTVHNTLHWGLLEPIYQEALYLELRELGIECVREQEIITYYKHYILDKKYRMDLLVEDDIIVELKSVTHLCASHRAQLCNYLRLTQKPLGILLNFGEECLNVERWVYDKESNRCLLVDKNMNPLENYTQYLDLSANDEVNNH